MEDPHMKKGPIRSISLGNMRANSKPLSISKTRSHNESTQNEYDMLPLITNSPFLTTLFHRKLRRHLKKSPPQFTNSLSLFDKEFAYRPT